MADLVICQETGYMKSINRPQYYSSSPTLLTPLLPPFTLFTRLLSIRMPPATMVTSLFLLFTLFTPLLSILIFPSNIAAFVYPVYPFTFHTDAHCHHAYIFVSSVYPVYLLTLHSNLPLQVLYLIPCIGFSVCFLRILAPHNNAIKWGGKENTRGRAKTQRHRKDIMPRACHVMPYYCYLWLKLHCNGYRIL